MANRSYLNFDLLLEQVGEDLYEARVTAAPVIDLPHVQFRLPFDDKGLKILLLELDPGRTDVRAVGGVQQRAAKEFGGPLFEAIFTGRLALAWTRSLDKVAAEKAGGLRLRLRISNEASDLAGLPWELLYDANGRAFPAQSEITPLVRFLDVTHEPDPIQVNGPLRVLAVISSPSNLPELDVEREWARIEAAMAAKVRQGLVVVDRLPEATVEELGEWLLNHDTHIIHFVGHGDFDPVGGEGFICFQNDRGGADPVTAAVLGPFIHDHDALRMVVINACRTARVSTDPYGGMAQGLVQQGATAVVAMQFPITDQAALMFTGKFYGALAAGLPVDQAVSYARKALQAKFRSEWATPVLFMRSPDGNIFQHVQAPPGWARHEPRGADTTGPDEIASTVPGPPVSDPAVADPAVVDPAVADPAVAELDPTDLDVTDVVGPSASDIAREPRPWELPGAEPDPYQFLFEREPPEPEPPEPERPEPGPLEPEPGPPEPGPPEPSPLEPEPSSWIRTHARQLATATAVLVLGAIALVLASRLLGDDLPAGEPLTESQMLVAAGGEFGALEIYLIDEDDPETKKPLTSGAKQSWLPVLSPDRRSMIYLRAVDEETAELRTAAAVDGTGERALDVPSECAKDVGRPAWIPATDDLVLRCEDDDDAIRLLRAGVDGDLVDVLLTVGSGEAAEHDLVWMGDPTVSGDGRYVVLWGRPPREELVDSGSLYLLDLDNGELVPLLAEQSDGLFGYSDAVFLQAEDGQEEWLAWRAGFTSGNKINFEVYAAPFTGGVLGNRLQISDNGEAKDQDPMFSPDGQSIIYGHQLSPTQQELVIATFRPPGDRQRVSAADPPFWAVPAWSGR